MRFRFWYFNIIFHYIQLSRHLTKDNGTQSKCRKHILIQILCSESIKALNKSTIHQNFNNLNIFSTRWHILCVKILVFSGEMRHKMWMKAKVDPHIFQVSHPHFTLKWGYQQRAKDHQNVSATKETQDVDEKAIKPFNNNYYLSGTTEKRGARDRFSSLVNRRSKFIFHINRRQFVFFARDASIWCNLCRTKTNKFNFR